MATLVLYPEDGIKQKHPLDHEQPVTLGRHQESTIVLVSPSVSSRHANLIKRDDGWYVQDLGSSNGTRVNGAPIEEALITDGDRIGFGEVEGIFYAADAVDLADEELDDEPIMAAAVAESAHESFIPPPPRPLPAARSKKNKIPSGYPGEESSGCTSALLITGLLIAAFTLGLYLRHSRETGGNFISDALGSVFGKLPKIQIEKKVDRPGQGDDS